MGQNQKLELATVFNVKVKFNNGSRRRFYFNNFRIVNTYISNVNFTEFSKIVFFRLLKLMFTLTLRRLRDRRNVYKVDSAGRVQIIRKPSRNHRF